MDKKLRTEVLEKIGSIYPFADKDVIVLHGSRAKGDELKDSDIDILIFTDNLDEYKDVSFQKKLRKDGEDPGFENFVDNKLLETKILSHEDLEKMDIEFYYDILHAVALKNEEKFQTIKDTIHKRFQKKHPQLLFKAYIHFFNQLKMMEGLSRRKDELSKMNMEMKKGIVVQSFLRLILLMEKSPYPFDKFLFKAISELEDADYILKLEKNINSIFTMNDYQRVKKKLKDYIDQKMSDEPYVGNWWKYLADYKACD